jgi:hypothetical protein
MTKQSETRWIVLTTDGQHATMGRHTDPSEGEIASAEEGLRRIPASGWLAVVRGRYYSREKLEVLMVRPLASPDPADWDRAVAGFLERRRVANLEG